MYIIRNIIVAALALIGLVLFFSLGVAMIALGVAASVVTALYVWYLRRKEEQALGKGLEALEEQRNQVIIDADYEEIEK